MNRLPKHVTLKHLNAFVAVAQESSFTRAAERLFQTQSSVTSLVRQLEEALSTLFRAHQPARAADGGGRGIPAARHAPAGRFDGAIGDVVRWRAGARTRGRGGGAVGHHQIIAPAAAASPRAIPPCACT